MFTCCFYCRKYEFKVKFVLFNLPFVHASLLLLLCPEMVEVEVEECGVCIGSVREGGSRAGQVRAYFLCMCVVMVTADS